MMSKYELRFVAAKLHDFFCRRNHTDGCGWYYEQDLVGKPGYYDNISDVWNATEHKKWLKSARNLDILGYEYADIINTINKIEIIKDNI